MIILARMRMLKTFLLRSCMVASVGIYSVNFCTISKTRSIRILWKPCSTWLLLVVVDLWCVLICWERVRRLWKLFCFQNIWGHEMVWTLYILYVGLVHHVNFRSMINVCDCELSLILVTLFVIGYRSGSHMGLQRDHNLCNIHSQFKML